MRTFGLLLQRTRHELGMTQEDVAYASGLTRSHYQQLEKGQSRPGVAANPSLLTVTALASTLGIELSELLDALERPSA
jgi:transcriptional regulator with XRE-family HTH domain